MKKSLYKATGIVFLLSLIAKMIGFVKSMIEASYFGASVEMDAYNVASGFVSNILYMLTTAIAVAFVPIYIKHNKDKGNSRKVFATRTITVLFCVSIIVSVFLALIAPQIIMVIAPSFGSYESNLAKNIFRVLTTGIVFSLMANMYVSILNAEKRYGYSTLSSIINSVVLILFIIGFSRKMGVWALTLALPVSFLIQGLTLFLIGHRYATISFKYGLKDEQLKNIVLMAAPVLLSQATVEINQVVDRALLSGVEIGALTAVSYSAVLYQFVTSLISMPISTVMFTELSEAGAQLDMGRIKNNLQNSYRFLLIISIPIIVITCFCSTDIVTFVYGHGRFSDKAIFQCSQGLTMYILCLLPVSIKSVLSRAYYGLGNTKQPTIYGILEVVLNIFLSVVLVKKYGIIGVVGATAIASIALVITMLADFNYRYTFVINKERLISLWKILIGFFTIIGVIAYIDQSIQLHPLLDFIVTTIIGFAVYFGLLGLLREKSFIQMINMIIMKERKCDD